MQINYSQKQKQTTQEVRNVLTELLACASAANTPDEQISMLKETLQALEDSFLVVVVGEFNAGKSSFINALLNTDKLAEGVTPTTAQINLIRYGETESVAPIENWGLMIKLPVDLLEDVSFVDTPGTNAVIQEHEVLTRWFLPRADMVIFLSSADRPFSESENKFLQSIRDWGKKTVLILNKIDLLETQEDRDQVINFVRSSAEKALNVEIPVIAVSSRLAKKARSAMSQDLWRESGFEALERFIQDKMDEKARFAMKMLSALGIAAKVEAEATERIQNELRFYNEDRKLTETIRGEVDLYHDDMMKEINRSMKEIHAIFSDVKIRGNDYFEDLFVVKNIPNILKKDKNRVLFQENVLQNMPTDVERKTTELVESLGAQQQRMVQLVRLQIENRNSQFPGADMPKEILEQRSELIKRMQNSIDSILEKIESDIALNIGMKHAQAAVTAGFAIEVSAIGIGAALTTIATTVAADLLGIVAAFWVGVAGFLVLPYYKKKAQREFDEKITEIEDKLVASLQGEFTQEVDDQITQINNATRPFERFVEASIESGQKQLDTLSGIHEEIDRLRRKVEE
ncbi:MAG: dynamin family protein [Anaerolineaceae bacterium]|nr:dynamin family protein [Anaerolineaceae bacterium]